MKYSTYKASSRAWVWEYSGCDCTWKVFRTAVVHIRRRGQP